MAKDSRIVTAAIQKALLIAAVSPCLLLAQSPTQPQTQPPPQSPLQPTKQPSFQRVRVSINRQSTAVLKELTRSYRIPRGLALYGVEWSNPLPIDLYLSGSALRRCASDNGIPVILDLAVKPTLQNVRGGALRRAVELGAEISSVGNAVTASIKKEDARKYNLWVSIASAGLALFLRFGRQQVEPSVLEGGPWISSNSLYPVSPLGGGSGLLLASYQKKAPVVGGCQVEGWAGPVSSQAFEISGPPSAGGNLMR